MAKKQMLEIYATVFPDAIFSKYEVDNITKEMLSVISAKTEPEAMKVIQWWGWDCGMTCLQAVRRIRKLAHRLRANK